MGTGTGSGRAASRRSSNAAAEGERSSATVAVRCGAIDAVRTGAGLSTAAFFDFFYDDMMSGVQKMMAVGTILSSPVVAGDTIYFGGADGNVYALM